MKNPTIHPNFWDGKRVSNSVIEVNFDGLVGPTHHYGGYAYGNIASMLHKKQISYPKKAALQSLKKMKMLFDLGLNQAVLPPHMRPSIVTLRSLGFQGNDIQVVEKAVKHSPSLYYALCSSASMWTANSATISPSSDTQDGRLHITVANLNSQFHRSIESEENYRLFKFLFQEESLFAIHPPLPKGGEFGDEGAANHTRFCNEYSGNGVHLFIYGKSIFETKKHNFPFRQSKEASESVTRLHGLDAGRIIFAQQNPFLIESGVFHNDVISVGDRNLFLYHELAFVNTDCIIKEIQKLCPLQTICVKEKILSANEAVKTYLFNGQLVTLPNGQSLLLLPQNCQNLDLSWLPLDVAFIDLSESMRNGGGPACLRLRCVLNEKEKKHVHPHIFFSDTLYQDLTLWIEKYFRDQLHLEDLSDPAFLIETYEALDNLTQILQLESFYEFQRYT